MTDDPNGRNIPFSRARELRDAIGVSASDERLRQWVAGDPSRAPLLDGKIVGTISWSHELGRPDRPKLADGFTINHHFESQEPTAGGPGTPAPTVEVQDTAPSQAWEGEDADRYFVGFFSDFHSKFGDNTLTVALTDVPWREKSPHFGARRVVPADASFPTQKEGFAAFSFEVIGTPSPSLPCTFGRKRPCAVDSAALFLVCPADRGGGDGDL